MPSNLEHETHVYLWLKEKLQQEHESLKDDEVALADTLEGITHLHEAVEYVVQCIAEDEEMVEGIKARQSALNERLKRIDHRIDVKRNLILETLQRIDQKKIMHPEFTITRQSKQRSVVIVDEAQLPNTYWKPQPPLPDKKAIKEVLNQGLEVPGAELSEPTETLVIRRG